MSRALVAIAIGIVLGLGLIVAWQFRGRDEPTVEVTEEQPAPVEGEQPPAPQTNTRTVTVGGVVITLTPDPNQTARLRREIPPDEIVEIPDPEPTPTPEQPPAGQEGQTEAPTAEPEAVPSPPVVEVQARDRIKTVPHVVGADDTLYSIATRYNTSVSLMAEYGIAQDHLIVGQTLNIPVAADNACASGSPYIVREGDNVFRISQRAGASQEAIRTLNNLGSDFLIRAGDVLCIP